MTEPRRIQVHAGWLDGAPRVGQLNAVPGRGKENFSFEYSPEWLSAPTARALDPALGLYAGPQYPAAAAPNFGLFLDSCPDRWGRMLMRRREALRARLEDRAPQRLVESDYLLGVHDGHRMGGLRFRVDGPSLDDDEEMAAPPWTSLRTLQQAAHAVEADDAEDDPQFGHWLRMLMAPGSSLGGARPKASVVDPAGELWLAKFPSRNDEEDVGAWEFVTHRLAKAAGLEVPEANLERFGGRHGSFLVRRFDRASGDRLHFASAMTLLERNDGDDAATGASYLELAEIIIEYGAEPSVDLRRLWRRIVFSICVANTDDHLRNHGFLLAEDGRRLSPAYDLNPNPFPVGLSLNISEDDNRLDLDLARDVAPYFSVEDADTVIDEVVSAVRQWDAVAEAVGLSRAARRRMANAFDRS